jgi:pimeloyl-ACP methyl ester carboxylesterase
MRLHLPIKTGEWVHVQSCLSMGWGSTTTTFGPQIELFPRNHRVIAMDLRGHGASDAPNQEYATPVLDSPTSACRCLAQSGTDCRR